VDAVHLLLLPKREAPLRSCNVGMERESARGINMRSANIRINFFVVREVLVHDAKRLFVYLEIVVLLKVVDREHPTSLLDVMRVLVGRARPSRLLIHLANLEDIVEPVKGYLDDLVVHHREQVAQGLDASLGDEVPNLGRLLQATGSRV